MKESGCRIRPVYRKNGGFSPYRQRCAMKTIAIIEDDPAIGDMLQEVLQKYWKPVR